MAVFWQYKSEATKSINKISVPDWNRTNNLQLRRLLLYPVELQAQKGCII